MKKQTNKNLIAFANKTQKLDNAQLLRLKGGTNDTTDHTNTTDSNETTNYIVTEDLIDL